MATLKDIANAIQVSPSLVSKVLNGKMGTSGANEKLIEKIKATALNLGYQKNLSAAMLQSGRHGSIGVLLHLPGNPGSGIVDQVITALTNGSTANNIKLQIRFYGSPSQFAELANEFNRSTCDGLLVIGIVQWNADQVLIELAKKNLPIVTVYSKSVSPKIHNINIDYASIADKLAIHFKSSGTQHILFNQAPSILLEEISNRLKKCGISIQQVLFDHIANDFNYNSGRQWTEEVLKSKLKFDTLLMACDDQAAAAIQVLQNAGIRVPHDVRVIGNDNAPWGNFFSCPLSTIHQKTKTRVELAVSSLIELIEGRKPQEVLIEPDLILRDSSPAQ